MQYFGFDRPSFGIKTFGFGSSEFSPLELFAGGKQGVWYDPSDKSTLFQDVAGIVPVTKDGDPVGLMLDKSQGLEGAVTNVAKPFIADASNSDIDITNTSEGTKIVYKNLAGALLHIFEVGKTYKLSVVYSIPETGSNINIYNTIAGVSNFLFAPTKGVRNKAEVTLTARSTALYFRASVGEITIHEVVLKEIKGNHAVQTVSTARPIYKTDGILHWLAFDGIDDRLNITLASAVPAPFTVAMGEKREGFNSTFNYLMDSPHPNKFSLYMFGGDGAMNVLRASSTFLSSVNSPINTAKAIFHNQVGLTGKVKSNSSATQTFALTDSPAMTSITLMSTATATGNVKGNIYSFLFINSDTYDNADMYDYVTRQSGVTL